MLSTKYYDSVKGFWKHFNTQPMDDNAAESSNNS